MYSKTRTVVKNCAGYNVIGLNCEINKKANEFFKNESENCDGFCNYCKKCSEKIFKRYKKTNSFSKSIFLTCSVLDLPYCRRIVDNIQTSDTENYTFSNYYTQLETFNKEEVKSDRLKYIGFAMSDDFVDEREQTFESNLTMDEKKQQKFERIKLWGVQDKDEDYIFLEDTYHRYTEDLEEFANAQQEDLYRDLCLARLTARKINDGRYEGDSNIDKIQTRITKLMSVLKVDEYKNNIPKTLAERSLFEKIRQCDTKTVKEVYDNFESKYKDMNKIKEYIEKFSLRPLLNTLVGHKDFNINLDDIDKYDELND